MSARKPKVHWLRGLTKEERKYRLATMAQVAKLDPRLPPAWSVRPLVRFRMTNPANSLGYALIDLVAITETIVAKRTVTTWHTLGYSMESKTWYFGIQFDAEICEILECYEVVA